MTSNKTTTTIQRLEKAGLRPDDGLVEAILGLGDDAYTPLLELATDVDMLHDDAPACYAPIHALRLLGEHPRIEMIRPLLSLLPIELAGDEDYVTQNWAEEIPQMIGKLGRGAVAPLWAIVDEATLPLAQRTAALISLGYTTAVDATLRDEIAAELQRRLDADEGPTMNAYIVVAMSDLGMSEVYPQVMQLYRQNRLDREMVPPGAARQLLLSSNNKRIACVNHPLWERYEQHGPFAPEVYRQQRQRAR